ncbi:MAG: PfkB family carbohydrate kinase [Elstera sp.]
MADLVCVGGLVWDTLAIAKQPVIGGTSNPVSASHSAGGVARNVAVLAARAGLKTELVSLIGHDAEGEILLRDLAADHVQTRLIAPHRHLPTANYAALLNPDGSLHVAWADMAVLEAMDPAFFEPLLIALSATPLWFLDTNLTAESLAYLAQFRPKGTRLVVDAVSVSKAERLKGALASINLLFCNRDEARLLTGAPDAAEALHLAETLREYGCRAVVVTDGPRGAAVAAEGFESLLPPVPLPGPIVDETGAGDSLVAGTLVGLVRGDPLLDAVQRGLRLAAETLTRLGV